MTNVLTALLLVLVAEASSAQQINIEAAQFEMLLAERKAVYTGDVYAIQGDHAINADKLVVFFDEDNKITSMEASGSPAMLTDQLQQPVLTLSGDKLDYLFLESTVRVSGNCILARGEDSMRAESIVYDLDAETARAVGNSQSRIRLTLAPKQP